MSEEKNIKQSMSVWVLLLLCILAVAAAWVVINWALNRQPVASGNKFTPYYRVPLNQMVTLADAIEAYTKKCDKRPASLGDLVDEELIERKMLFDPERKTLPAAGAPYDVIYNPAVRPDDPKDCVILYTIFLEDPTEPFYAVHNDYTISQFKPRELVRALNNTYRIVGQAIVNQQQAAKTATTQPVK